MKTIIRVFFLSLILTGCNFFSWIDKPSGDSQILAAARACFDQGDFPCASSYYGHLSAANSDVANLETAFELLDQNGAPTSVFVNAVISGSSNGAKLITTLANTLQVPPSQTTRLGFFHAYQKYNSVSDQRARGLIRFTAGLALLAELLAEDASTVDNLQQTDIATNPAKCLVSMNTLLSPNPALFFSTVPNTGCENPASKKLITGSIITSLDSPTSDTEMTGTTGVPTLYMVNAAATSILDGLSQMETIGALGSAATTFANSLLSVASQALTGGTGDSPLYRGTLIQLGIGAN